jgi:DNA-binding CsgD family transcriptional regulator
MSSEDAQVRWEGDVLGALISGSGQRFLAPPGTGSARRVAEKAEASGITVIRSQWEPSARNIAGGSLLPTLNELVPNRLPAVPLWKLSGYRRPLLARVIADALESLASTRPVLVVSSHEKHDLVIADVNSILARRRNHGGLTWIGAEDAIPAVEISPEQNAMPRTAPIQDDDPLPETIGVILTLTAIAPVALSVADLAELAGSTETEIRSAAQHAASEGLVDISEDLILPAHDHIVDDVLADVPEAVRLGLHLAIAKSLWQRGFPAALLLDPDALRMGGLQRRTRGADVRLREIAVAAIHELKTLSPRDATRFGEQALDMFRSDDDPGTRQVAEALLLLLWETSQMRQAVELTARLFTGRVNDGQDADGMLWRARVEPTTVDALRLTGDGLALAVPGSLTHARLSALRLFYLARLGFNELVSAEASAALLEAAARDDSESLGLIHVALSSARFQSSQFEDARDLAGVAVARMRATDTPLGYWGIPALWQAHIQHALGDSPGALAIYDDIAAQVEREGQTAVLLPLAAVRASALLALGRLDEAAPLLAESPERPAASIDDRMGSVAIRGRIHLGLFRGDREALLQLHDLLEPPATGNADAAIRRATWRLLISEELERDSEMTTAIADLRVAVDEQDGALPWTDPEDDVVLMRTCMAMELSDLAERCVRSAALRRQRNPKEAIARAISTHVEGLMFSDIAKLNTAAQAWRTLRRPLLEADAYSAAGELAESHAPRSGAPSLEAAHRIYHSAGASRRAARVRRLLRASGRSMRQPADTAANRSDGLTWMEREVIARAVRGSSSTRIAADLLISRHTVIAHLRSVYLKLGVTSREGLAEWYRAASPRDAASEPDDFGHLLP